MGYFPKWKLKTEGVIAPDERLPLGQMIPLGAQHVVAMFGSTILAPLLMGFDPNLCVLMSGIGTLIFFLVVGGHLPSYLGSSFAFIGVVCVATGYTAGTGVNPNIGVALGGIIVVGILYAIVGITVIAIGVRWIERIMPPVVIGGVCAVVGLNLAPTAIAGIGTGGFNAFIAIVTCISVGAVAVFTHGLMQKLLILMGIIISYAVYFVMANLFGMGKPIDFTPIINAPWIGFPTFTAPKFELSAITLIAPVVVILVVENLSHVKLVTSMTGKNLDKYMGRAFLGDSLATILAGCVGGTGVTTYGENIGVMAANRIYSTLLFVIAGIFAILLGLSPKFGAIISTIPQPLLGGVSVIVFGLIAVAGARVWVVNHVDFSNNRNLLVAAVTLIFGAGDFTVSFYGITLGGIGTATFAAILLNFIMNPSMKEELEPNELNLKSK